MMSRPRLDATLGCARRGWSVLPVWGVGEDGSCACGSPHERDPRQIGKHPLGSLVPHGAKDATTDEATLRLWWEEQPDANVGVATGEGSDLLVLDVDGEEGFESLRVLEGEHGGLPPTVCQITGGGGCQYFFAHFAGLKNAVKVRPGLDIRTDGGYAIVPPSRHRSGHSYQWECEGDPDDVEVSNAPAWLIGMIPKREPTERACARAPSTPQPPAVVEQAKRYIDKIEGAISGQGGHNRTFRVACTLVHRFALPLDQAMALMLKWNLKCEPPWSEKDLLHKLTDAQKTERRDVDSLDELPEAETVPAVDVRFRRGDDAEVAGVLLDALSPDRESLVHDEGRIHLYLPFSGLWVTREPELLRKIIRRMAGSPKGENGTLKVKLPLANGAMRFASDEVHMEGFFAGAAGGIAFSNGFLRLAGGNALAFSGHDKRHRARWGYEFGYDPNAVCPSWLDFVEQTFEGATDAGKRIACLQEFAGACLLGIAPRHQRALVGLGVGANGKGVALAVIAGVMPPGTVESIAPQTWGNEYRLARLSGKLLNVVNELPELELMDTEAIKCVIAGDPTTARHIREAPFRFTPIAGHIFAANRLPRTSDSSHGFWRRWIVLRFDRVVPEDKQIPDLAKAILTKERPAIVNWALRGAQRLLAAGHYTVPPSSIQALEQWQGDADPIRCFVRECARKVAPGGGGDVANLVYKRYKAYAKENGFRAVAHNVFGARLRSIGLGAKHTSHGNVYPFTIGGGGPSLFDDARRGHGESEGEGMAP